MTKITEKDIPPPLEKNKPKKEKKVKEAELKIETDTVQEPVELLVQEDHSHTQETLPENTQSNQEAEKSSELLRKYEEVLERLNKQVAEPVKPKVKKRSKRKPQVRIVEQWNEPQVVQAIATNSNDRLYRQIFYRRK